MNKRFLIVLSFCIIASMAVIHSIAAPDDTNVWGKADNANKEKKEETQAGAQAKKDDSKMTAAERRRQAAAERRKKAEEEKNKSTLEKYREKQARLKVQEDTIPDSLLHPRWKIQRTQPITYDDINQGVADLKRPENIKQTTEYNDTTERYIIGSKLGMSWLGTPIMMEQGEFLKWSEHNLFRNYFKEKNAEIFQQKGKEKFDFTDMHFDLGPAEKIFGPGGIQVKTQGSAELKLGATMKSIDNPSLPIRNRNTTTIDFDEKININVTGKVGDKMNMNLNYNTDATFDYDMQNMKLRYDGKEDEIIKLVEAGNVSFPSNSSLV